MVGDVPPELDTPRDHGIWVNSPLRIDGQQQRNDLSARCSLAQPRPIVIISLYLLRVISL
jgi:hypothetical protein